MRAEEFYKKVLENSKAKMSAPGEMKKPTYANFGTPNNHVTGKGNETSEVKGTEASLGKRKDKKPTAKVGKPGLNKEYMQKRNVPVKKLKEQHSVADGMYDPKEVRTYIRQLESIGPQQRNYNHAQKQLPLAVARLEKLQGPVSEHKALGGSVEGEMKTPTYKKDKPVRSAKVRKGDPYLKANKADPGKPKGNSPGTEKMKVAVAKVKESVNDVEEFLGCQLDIGKSVD